MESKRILREQLQQEASCVKTLEATLAEVRGENDKLEQSLKDLNDQYDDLVQKYNDMYDNHQRIVAESEAIVKDLEEKLSKSEAEAAKLRNEIWNIENLKRTITRLVEPVSLSEVVECYKRCKVIENASHYAITKKGSKITWRLPKWGLRLRRSNGTMANLLIGTQYPTLQEDNWLRSNLPQAVVTELKILFVSRCKRDEFLLANPRTAEEIEVSFLCERSEELDAWCNEHEALIYHCTDYLPDKKNREIHLVMAFPGKDPTMQLLRDEAESISDEEIQAMEQERQSRLREQCYQQYLTNYFSLT